jgi:hypothetical protein
MTKRIMAIVLTAVVLLAGNTLAQQDDSQKVFVHGTYFVCSPDRETRADDIINTSFKPHYDAAVEQEDILSWRWLAHFVGGNWRRVLVIIASDMDSIIDASGAIGEAVSDTTPEAGRAFSVICSSHEDYIWETEGRVGSGAATDRRGEAGFSVYMQCDLSKEERADQLVREVFGPIYERHVGEGELTSWNWLRRNVGGKWRRLLTMSAEDHISLTRARAAIAGEFDARKVERAAEEMNKICHTHQDYMWDILLQSP